MPKEGSLFISSPGAKYYWLSKEIFQLVDGILFRQKMDSKDLELVVPDTLKEQAMALHHDITRGLPGQRQNSRKSFCGFGCHEMLNHMLCHVLYATRRRRISATESSINRIQGWCPNGKSSHRFHRTVTQDRTQK